MTIGFLKKMKNKYIIYFEYLVSVNSYDSKWFFYRDDDTETINDGLIQRYAITLNNKLLHWSKYGR